MTENVTSINQNGNDNQVSGAVGEIFALQEGRINRLRQERDEMFEALQQGEKEPISLEEALNSLEPPEDYEQTYQIRRMNQRDFKRLITMIRKVWDNEDLQGAMARDENGNLDQLKLMNEAMKALLIELEAEFIPWLADLAGKTSEEWEEEGFSASIDMLNDLKANPDFLKGLRSATYFVMTGKKLFGR